MVDIEKHRWEVTIETDIVPEFLTALDSLDGFGSDLQRTITETDDGRTVLVCHPTDETRAYVTAKFSMQIL